MVTKVMGLLLFVVGLFLIILATLALLSFLPIGLFERFLVFGGGLLLCVVGYVMARNQPIG